MTKSLFKRLEVCILKIGFVQSKRPHFNSAYVLGVFTTFLAIVRLVLLKLRFIEIHLSYTEQNAKTVVAVMDIEAFLIKLSHNNSKPCMAYLIVGRS